MNDHITIRKASLIYNPTAGSLRRDSSLVERLCAALSARGIAVTPLPTARAGHAAELARQAAAAATDCVIVCGGDGTINEAAQSLVHTQTTMAIWPGGTANVLAKDLAIPRDVAAWAEMIAAGQTRTVSVGRAWKPGGAWQRYFLLMAGIGLDATIVQSVDLELKKRAGIGAYVASGLDFLRRLPLTPFAITFNGARHESTFAVIANAASYAACFTIAPQARLEAGNFDVCLFNSRSRLAFLGYALLSLTGSHTRAGGVVYQSTASVHANSNDAALVQLDGEIVGRLPMDFEIVPAALRIVAPTATTIVSSEVL